MKHHKVWIQRSATPEDAPIPSTWAYRRKLGANNQVIEYKARIVSPGGQGHSATASWIRHPGKYGPRAEESHLRAAPGPKRLVPKREDTFLFVHVDDLVIISQKPEIFKTEMELKFSIKYMGKAVFLLGMNIERTHDALLINQTQYIKRKLAEYDLDTLHPATCPLAPGQYLKKATQTEIEELRKLGHNYCALVGLLNYLSVLTPPNIAYAVSSLSQYLEALGINHYYSAVQVFRYLSGTRHLGLTFKKENAGGVKAFVEADWDNCPDTCRSVTGFAVLSGQHLIAWKSTKQPTVSLSTAEAEYKAMSDVGQELAWLDNLITAIEINAMPQAFQLLVNIQGAIDLAKSETSQNSFRTKHMSLRLHFIRELLVANLIELKHVKSSNNAADILTKPCGRSSINRSLAQLNPLTGSKPALPLSPRSTAGCWNETQTPNPKRLKGLDPCPRHQLEKDPVQSTRDDKNKQLLETPRENEESLLNRTTNQLNNRETSSEVPLLARISEQTKQT
ncbi:hypothetical protein PCASD_22738 [Puccinia coronata f. sp. avenae]|uniref:Reverse transcriptase Ty1/copia-type domain-containing protein n=1 Tax=Puccinia coronata f. sp. avenae TaxID=200324 RepID=A0A2N5T0A5_9BASI|nr:hypothetical protein PCASD_22738 [Puccinia coronata f. sp. avenae]